MKKLILLMIFCLGITLSNLAQNNFLTKEEYDSALIKAAQKQKNISRRETSIINFYDAKKAVYEKRSSIREQISSDIFRTFSTTEKDGKVAEKYEFIRIGKVEYKKKDDEPWKRQELPKDGVSASGGGFKVGGPIKTQRVEEYLLLPAVLDAKPVTIYLHYDVIKLEDENNLTFIESRNTISAEGLTLKWTYKVSKTVPENISHISTTTYEYNPKDLKIEAPKIP